MRAGDHAAVAHRELLDALPRLLLDVQALIRREVHPVRAEHLPRRRAAVCGNCHIAPIIRA